MADATTATATDVGAGSRPQKPDEAQYKSELAELQKKHDSKQAAFKAAVAKLDAAKTGKGSPQNDRFQELRRQQDEIRAKQSAFKSSRQVQQTRYDANDREIKAMISSQKEAKSRMGYKNAGEIETKIKKLMEEVDSGRLKLVDEKKNLAEVSNLRKQIKGFGVLDEMEGKIEAKKKENAELRGTFDNAETKALSDRYEANQKEMDEINKGRDDSNKNWSKLRAEKDAAHAAQEETWAALKAHKDAYYTQRKEFKDYEDRAYQARREKQKQERDAYEKERRQRDANTRLAEAENPAFLDEILTAEGLIKHFDPTYGADAEEKGPGKFAAVDQRKVDESGFKGMTVMKKEEEDFFVGGGSKKKGKSGKKAGASDKFNLGPDIIQGCAKVGVDPPSSQSDIPAVVEKLKGKVAAWKQDQAAETQKNIEKAKAEIAKLEREASEASSMSSAPRARGTRTDRGKKTGQKDAGIDNSAREVNVDADQVRKEEHNGVADAAHDLKNASLEDKENVGVATA